MATLLLFALLQAPGPSTGADPYPDLPPLEDVGRFPILRDVALAQYLRCRECREQIAALAHVWPEQIREWEEWDDRLAHWFAVWDALTDAQSPRWLPHRRRERLRDLERLLGHEAYDAGRLPPQFPLGVKP
jgi:hypothetical protein